MRADLLASIEAKPAVGHARPGWPRRDRGRAGILLMRQRAPHLRQVSHVARRLKADADRHRSLERALDWLTDGVALLTAEGTVVYANEGLRAIARRDDGIRLRKDAIEFSAAEPREKFHSAIAASAKLASSARDFLVARPSGAEHYLVSVRPLTETASRRGEQKSIAALFVHAPQGRSTASIATLRELFGLTEAEAHLAQALQSGVALGDYAGARALSLNTVYTHLRRVREKTGCSRMAELIRKLDGLQIRLRTD
jgi:DNA-binding CsgD family transcriptional regulator